MRQLPHSDQFRRMSTKIDQSVLNECLSNLDDADAEAVCNFIASYRGPDVVAAMYAHLAKIQDLRASEQQTVDEMPVKPLDWESLDLDGNDVIHGNPQVLMNDHVLVQQDEHSTRRQRGGGAAHENVVSAAQQAVDGEEEGDGIIVGSRSNRGIGGGADGVRGTTGAYGSTTEDGIFSDENDVWAETEGGHSAESDWIMLDDLSLTDSMIPTLQHLPKRALTKILIYSQNPNLLKTSRRLSRLPLPTLGTDLATVIMALLPPSVLFTPAPSSSSSTASEFAASASPHLNEILTRAAHSPYANRSPLTFPRLATLAQAAYPQETISVETLSAVLDIGCKEKRWNSVRGVLSLSQALFSASNNKFGVVISVDDLAQQHMRRPFVPSITAAATAAVGVAEGTVPPAIVLGGSVYGCLSANVIANHGKALNLAFFKDLVEEGGLVFDTGVIRHCSEQYGISATVVDYLLQKAL
ncbi:hypothetical protein BDR26DRAFT_870167 [Obelidium mucronatum]|nr:hypothetical protein BDR26DRAFT_870167 [Obelidium mucronatum]